MSRPSTTGPTTLAIDIGGTGLKASVLDSAGKLMAKRVRTKTSYPCPPDALVDALEALVARLRGYDRVSARTGFDPAGELQARLGHPVRVASDADSKVSTS